MNSNPLLLIVDDECWIDRSDYSSDPSHKRGWLNSVPERWLYLDEPGVLSKWLCLACNKCYKHRRCLARHLKLECGKLPMFHCPHCPLRCYQRSNLTVHMKVKHSDKLFSERF
ncbi:zinc finger protein 711-like [Lycorma delicatula]|uniref:zinc finger protein 711-like n=1 Tax=Lycorma delicatula TaxID=130591 RepID=UPI003F51796B